VLQCVAQCVAVTDTKAIGAHLEKIFNDSMHACVAGCCRVLQCVTVCYSALMQCVAARYTMCCSHRKATGANSQEIYDIRCICGSQGVAVCCSVLQCAAIRWSVLKCVARDVLQCLAVCCSVLQCVAVCCSVLQFVAVCCSVLQCVAV